MADFWKYGALNLRGPFKGNCGAGTWLGQNRDRMINRARLFGQWGYTTVIHSARDHGNSSRFRMMSGLPLC
ncbi:MAG: hypothetical protein R2941_03830 [Desulfobacterales bacterium]